MSGERQQELVAGLYESFNTNNIDAALSVFSTELETIDPEWEPSMGMSRSASIWRSSRERCLWSPPAQAWTQTLNDRVRVGIALGSSERAGVSADEPTLDNHRVARLDPALR
jgi:hypothetical protein